MEVYKNSKNQKLTAKILRMWIKAKFKSKTTFREPRTKFQVCKVTAKKLNRSLLEEHKNEELVWIKQLRNIDKSFIKSSNKMNRKIKPIICFSTNEKNSS